jgi:hypothetical protein
VLVPRHGSNEGDVDGTMTKPGRVAAQADMRTICWAAPERTTYPSRDPDALY